MTDVLLAHAYYLRHDVLEQKVMRPYVPLGILYVSAFLKRAGYETAVFDATFREPSDFAEELRRRRPRTVGIYANIITRPWVGHMIRAAKDLGIPVVIGGPDGFARKEEHLDSGADAIVKGEGESTMAELLAAIRAGARGAELAIPGVTTRVDGALVVGPERTKVEELDSLPWPDREAVELEPYFAAWRRAHGETSLTMITARGCPYSCTWCSRQVFGKSHRRRSVQDVVSEMLHMKERYRPDRLWIADDVLTMKRPWVMEFVAEVRRRDAVIPFEAVTRANLLDDELVEALATTGCFRLWFGAESGVDKILRRMKRGYHAEQIVKATRSCQARGIAVGHFIMLGYPSETRDDVRGTIEFLDEARPDLFGISVAFPMPGTAFYQEVEDELVDETFFAEKTPNRVSYRSRYPALFYWLAVRWVQGEVALRKARRGAALSPRLLARIAALTAKSLALRGATWAVARSYAHRVAPWQPQDGREAAVAS